MASLSWLDLFFGPGRILKGSTEYPQRPILEFVGSGITVADDEEGNKTVVTVAASSSPTGDGIPHVVSGVMQAAASKIVNADVDAAAGIAVTKLATAASADEVLCRVGSANAFQKIVNANVSASAAIDGSKVAPDFGAQNVVTTGYVSVGSTPATAGTMRFPNAASAQILSGGNNLTVWQTSGDNLYLGTDSAYTGAKQVSTVQIYGAAGVGLGYGGSQVANVLSSGQFQIYTGVNLSVLGSETSSSFGGGAGVVYLGNATTQASSNPSNGSIVESYKGTLRHRASTGREGILTLDSDGANLVDILAAFATPTAVGASVCTVGSSFYVTRACKCLGVRFYWATASKTIKCQLWSGASSIASVSTLTSGTGIFSHTFASPVSLSANTLYVVSAWQTDNANYSKSTLTTADTYLPRRPYQAGGQILVMAQVTLYTLGDAKPVSTASSEAYAVEPILEYS